MKTNEEITKIINEELNILGITKKEMCKSLGINYETVRSWGRVLLKDKKPHVSILVDISQFLNISLDYLLNENCTIRQTINN